MYIVSNSNDNDLMFIRHIHDNINLVDLDDLSMKNDQYLVAMYAKVYETG